MKDGKKDKSTEKREDRKITRKEAIKKAGYAAFSAATMMLLLNDPAKAQAETQSNPAGNEHKFEDFGEW